MQENTNEAVKIEADLAKQQALAEKEHAIAIKVTTPEEYRVAVENLKACTARHRELEAKRKAATSKLDEAKKEIMGWYRPALDNLDSAIMTLRRGIAAYERDQKAREEAEVRRYSQALVEGREGDKQALAKAFEGAVEKVDGVQKRTIWKYEITDEAQLPREFLVPDTKRINDVVRSLKGECVIPGVRVFAETSIAVKGESDVQY